MKSRSCLAHALLFVACACFTTTVSAQLRFERAYHYIGNESNTTIEMMQLVNGLEGILKVSNSLDTCDSFMPSILTCMDGTGRIMWDKEIAPTDGNIAYRAIQDYNSDYVITGFTSDDNKMGFDNLYLSNENVWMIKYNQSGVQQWAFEYPLPKYQTAWDVEADANNNYFASGYHDLPAGGAPYEDWILYKIGVGGNLIWTKFYGGNLADRSGAHDIDLGTGDVTMSGNTASAGAGNYDIGVIDVNNNGAINWAMTYGGLGYEEAYIINTSDGGHIMAGFTNSWGTGPYSGVVVKLSATGVVQWAKVVTLGMMDYFYDIVEVSDGYVAAGGTNSVDPNSYHDMLLVKFDLAGNMQWSKIYGGTYDDYAFSIDVGQGDDLIFAGDGAFGGAGQDQLVMRTALDGTFDDCSCHMLEVLPTIIDAIDLVDSDIWTPSIDSVYPTPVAFNTDPLTEKNYKICDDNPSSIWRPASTGSTPDLTPDINVHEVTAAVSTIGGIGVLPPGALADLPDEQEKESVIVDDMTVFHANGEFRIQVGDEYVPDMCTIYDINGKPVLRKAMTADDATGTSISSDGIASGVYVVTVRMTNGTTQTARVTVAR